MDKVWCQILEKVRAVWGLCRGQFQVFIRVPDCPAESRTIFGTIRWGASGLASFYGHRATRSAGSRGSAPGRRLAPPGWPPTTLSFNLGVGGRQPGGHRARKKSPGYCKSTRRALPFVVLKFPRRAMLPRQVMAICSWRLFPSTGPPHYRPENCPGFPRLLGFGVSLSIWLSRGASHFAVDFRVFLTRFWRKVTVKIGLALSPNPVYY